MSKKKRKGKKKAADRNGAVEDTSKVEDGLNGTTADNEEDEDGEDELVDESRVWKH